jgi:hypothetical protein
MNRSTLARRYAPLAALAVIQLLIIATVPSTAAKRVTAQATTGGGGFAAGSQSGVAGGTDNGATGTGSNSSGVSGAAGGATGGFGSTSVTAGGGVGGQAAVGSAPPGVAAGDKTHCVGGREFDPAIAYWAPPCVPGTPGTAAGINNGGATAPGVTANEITIVNYNGDAGAEVDAILQAEGLYESYQQSVVMDKAYENFINKEYVLYGRHVHIISYQGQCQTVPPDTNCLIPEMDKIAAQYHPYAVEWGDNSVCSACYAELARNHVIALGGVGFSDEFANQNAPYFYSLSQSSSRVEKAFAEFYCKQLAHSPVKFAETQNPAQNFNGKPRVLGIISTNDPDNKNTVQHVLVPLLKSTCGVDVTHFYFYAQDINTAAQQVAAGIAAMDTPTNPASIVLCLCDAVAPAFLYEGEKANNYFPENVLATDQGMDLDRAAQSYESGLGCPGGGQCEFDTAFGLSPNGPQQPAANNEGRRIYAIGGGTNMPVDPTVNNVYASDYVMLANLIENTGPDLTPANMLAQAPAMGSVGGGSTGLALLAFTPGNTSWQQDDRIVYWDRNRKSPYNDQPGTFVQIEGGRYNLGQFPTVNEPPIPDPRPA